MTTWAWTFNGLTFGQGTNINVKRVRGLGHPKVRSSAVRYASAHGAASGIRTYEPRAVTMELEYADQSSDAAFETLNNSVRRALKLTDTDGSLVASLPGQVDKRLYCYVEDRSQDIDEPWKFLYAMNTVVQFVADDPLFYTDALTTTDLNPGGGATTVPNAGDEDTFNWSAVITGPATDPKIVHENGTVLDFTGYSITGGQTITINAHTFAVFRESGTDIRHELTGDSDFFPIEAGGSDLTFTVASGAADLDVSVRAAWSALT